MKADAFVTALSTVLVIGLLGGCASVASQPVPDQAEVAAPESDALEAETAESNIDTWGQWDGYGTTFITPDVITPESPSDFVSISYVGIEDRETYDRRVPAFVTNASWVFTATYRCAPAPVDVIVNPEFTEAEALEEATRIAEILGRLPIGPRTNVGQVAVHAGNELAGGGGGSITVHSDYVTTELQFGFMEEVLIHEASHASLDYDQGGIVDQALWVEAAEADNEFVSGYAREFPLGGDTDGFEDIAESYGAFLIWALHRDQGIFPESAAAIEALIPARLAYFESLGPDFGPLSAECG